jgi:hypothetical protein
MRTPSFPLGQTDPSEQVSTSRTAFHGHGAGSHDACAAHDHHDASPAGDDLSGATGHSRTRDDHPVIERLGEQPQLLDSQRTLTPP